MLSAAVADFGWPARALNASEAAKATVVSMTFCMVGCFIASVRGIFSHSVKLSLVVRRFIDQRFPNLEVPQQISRMARVFAAKIDVPESLKRALRDVVEISDPRAGKIKQRDLSARIAETATRACRTRAKTKEPFNRS